jgi:hypothetical protein
MKRPDTIQSSRSSRTGFGFLVVAIVFAIAMPFTTVPTPLTRGASTRGSLLVFVGLLGLGILAATRALLDRQGSRSSSQPQPAST